MVMGWRDGCSSGNCPSDKHLSNSLSLIRKPQVACSIQVAGSSTFLVFLFPADCSSKVATILKAWSFKGASSGSELTHRRSSYSSTSLFASSDSCSEERRSFGTLPI